MWYANQIINNDIQSLKLLSESRDIRDLQQMAEKVLMCKVGTERDVRTDVLNSESRCKRTLARGVNRGTDSLSDRLSRRFFVVVQRHLVLLLRKATLFIESCAKHET